MTNIEKAVKLYKKYIDGIRWLDDRKIRGIDVVSHEADFDLRVVEPMDKLWEELSPGDRDNLDKITELVWGFSGSITLMRIRGVFLNTVFAVETEDSPLCPRCKLPGERYIFASNGKKCVYGLFCLKCEPFPDLSGKKTVDASA